MPARDRAITRYLYIHAFSVLLAATAQHAAIASAVAQAESNAGGIPATAPEQPVQTGSFGAVWLEVSINQKAAKEITLVMRSTDGHLFVRAKDLARWRIIPPDTEPVRHEDEDWYSLSMLRGWSHHLDEASQSLEVNADASLFEATEMRGTEAGMEVLPLPSTGAFVNYDITAVHGQDADRTGGLFELAISGARGTGLATFSGKDLGREPLTRLESAWVYDRPAEFMRLRVGDSLARTGSWGQVVRFGGIQWGTNYLIRPQFIAMPLPAIAGQAEMPSTVEVYVNDSLRMRRNIPAGPFVIHDLPVDSGAGEARLVIRDALGREQVVHSSYHASPQLLRPGLHDFSFSAGLVRRNYGVSNNDYGPPMLAAVHRLGLNRHLTGEIGAQLQRQQQTAGVAGHLLLPAAGLFSAALAGSRSEAGNGGHALLAFSRQGRNFGFGISNALTSERFGQAGFMRPLARRSSRAYASLSGGRYGSLTLAYLEEERRTGQDTRSLTAGYGVSAAGFGYISLSLHRRLSGPGSTSARLSYTRSFGKHHNASVSASGTSGNSKLNRQVALQRNLGAGNGFGYALRSMHGSIDANIASVSARTAIGDYRLEAAESSSIMRWHGNASGSIALLDGEVHLSRRIDDSFALVRVPGFANVRVYADNQLVARTNSSGSALVPGLRAFQQNPIRISHSDLPLDTEIPTFQTVVIPAYRSGTLATFTVTKSSGALLTLVTPDGRPISAGATAQIVGQTEQFPVGHGGEVYVTGLAGNNRLQVTWNDQMCEIDVSFHTTGEALPHLGTYTCKEAAP